MKDKLNLLTSIVPNERQLIIQSMMYYAFVHFSINTFTGKEWGDGSEKEQLFNPKSLSVEQWCQAIKDSEMTGIVITAKHHDGFCIWQTKTTEYSIKNSPYKSGKGDIIKELSCACKKFNLKLGLYLSLWDRNSKLYGTADYMDFYIQQLTELLTQYGEIFMLWLDGACGAAIDGKIPMQYDFERITKTALKYQPKIVVANQGPDIRWVGNESGIARAAEWNVVPADDAIKICEEKQQENTDFKKFQKDAVKNNKDVSLNMRNIEKFNKFVWKPAEVDVSIRPGWFYHKREDLRVKSIKKLMKIYYGAVGGNSLLLLNIPPNKKGLFCKRDVKRLKEMGDLIRLERTLEIDIDSLSTTSHEKTDFPLSNLMIGDTFSPQLRGSYDLTIKFTKATVDRICIQEDTRFSQRIEEFEIMTIADDRLTNLYKGETIGFNRIAIFVPILTDNLTIRILRCRNEPYIKTIRVFKKGGFRP
ncbi:MAG: alpha-L-fucosidase [Christensenellaceae bacterium]|jgi:alpha-L-fucosidase|nr:alpha-L-fucosidase [Christensenellaceae bacterium]